MRPEENVGDLAGNCALSWGRIRGFMQPCLLLLLKQEASHGYELMDRLNQVEDDLAVDSALVYRTLRQLEQSGLVRSAWHAGERGPARRLYHITSGGIEHLHNWVVNIQDMRKRLDRFLSKYDVIFDSEEEGGKTL